MLNATEREILQQIVDMPLSSDAIPALMTLERAFCSVAGRAPTASDYAEVRRQKASLTEQENTQCQTEKQQGREFLQSLKQREVRKL